MPTANIKYDLKRPNGSTYYNCPSRSIQVSNNNPSENEIISKLEKFHLNDIKKGNKIIINKVLKVF